MLNLLSLGIIFTVSLLTSRPSGAEVHRCESWTQYNGVAMRTPMAEQSVNLSAEIIIQLYPFGINAHELYDDLVHHRYVAVPSHIPVSNPRDRATGWFVYTPRGGDASRELGILVRENSSAHEVEVVGVFQVSRVVARGYRNLAARQQLHRARPVQVAD